MSKVSLPKSIWVLGFVSMLMDISSEMIHSLLPMFMVGTLGMSVFAVGLIDGIAESTTLLVKVFSGALSDKLGKRKALAVFGYGMSAFTKPLFAIAQGMDMLLTARLMDRIGKGIRGAPRDALIADITPPSIRGEAFGLRQSLDTIGAVAGPLLASGLMLLWANDFRQIFWLAVIPGLAAMLLLFFGVHEPASVAIRNPGNPVSPHNLRRMGRSYWWVVLMGSIFTLARFSEAFLVLRAQQLAIPVALVPLVMVAMNLVYSVSAYPFGKLSDRISHQKLLAAGLAVLIASDLMLGYSTQWAGLLAGIALWGVHMGMTQGLLASMVAASAPPDLRGTAFGFFNLASGVGLLLASVIAGLLWQEFGAAFTFYTGAAFAGLSLLALLLSSGYGLISRS
ncbi:MFS transporter [Undibacterium oligocarboniphilum]|uniref:MFS transporter n=1 Tax=Undibacterium oligocarboniphilum TaxID=666702 RepID=A0A850QDT0_9BURK|nr:MFS transporter [Undibacterium oligocarboniphilum]MBC3870587.1 MFS transporter [Undibacterium oligocarboniphilum]NVO78612.1 MFS transporter [Undibacterium oligocarboniphilum]